MEPKNNILPELIDTLQYYENAKDLLDGLLEFYDIHSQQFNPITVYRIPPHGDKSQPKSLWKSRSDELNEKIRKYLNYDDSE